MKSCFYKIPNDIFKFFLSPAAFKIYIYLTGKFWFIGRISIKHDTIAKKCKICKNTVKRAVLELENKGLISITRCYGEHNKRLSNAYTLVNLPGRFSKLDKKVLNFDLDNSTFMIFCYLNSKCNHAGNSFPSISRISRETGLSRGTVINKAALLHEKSIVLKQNNISQYGDFGNNSYIIISLKTRLCLIFLLGNISNFQSNAGKTPPINNDKNSKSNSILTGIAVKLLAFFTLIGKNCTKIARLIRGGGTKFGSLI